jgi:hypothetical protein
MMGRRRWRDGVHPYFCAKSVDGCNFDSCRLEKPSRYRPVGKLPEPLNGLDEECDLESQLSSFKLQGGGVSLDP